MVLKQTVKASKDELEIVEIAVKAVKPRRWRKCPDRQLGQQVAGKVLDKEELGMKEKLKRYRIMSQAKRKWRKMFRYDRWD